MKMLCGESGKKAGVRPTHGWQGGGRDGGHHTPADKQEKLYVRVAAAAEARVTGLREAHTTAATSWCWWYGE